ncbi:NADH:flavin oxidoreductase/NADH oxidase [Alicyclobacillus tolerans]|uniref:2,4-dienoyl-CoA reductase-like NADH-dependent reductase (Old Yellow Enzyme family) n=2 Tax=Alicyclobacillus tolerans TaxID=90970 RepID=A0ABT9LS87_9BACL|nr:MULTISPECIES: NADH:flavin oxidoreductase/NADH oxidase [Alicyclobacillus]MDP9727126.1 2,4-dienoyl-CoA reductase-like NADH-dependent reductase (Old Yellow Enzyme family) [Alicyclobacillus tengchongensis]QRF22897.1 NADH:flavin oxidoreductase/NADH oxidase [Alicyclobacillus sp. TC]SHK47771.1 2,4-dienoyl-CoA reductase [Alicyclobacillus montanus]
MAYLFTPFQLKGLELKNRIVMAPMCQYSVTAKDGKPNDWHYTHLTSRAIGGTGLILVEMTDVEPDGRITDYDLGLWSDDQIPAFARIIDACHNYGSKIGIQIAHAGRKAEDAVQPVAPSAIPFEGPRYKTPKALSTDEVKRMVEKFGQSARRAVQAGVDTIELHGAHGYLIHQFQSPYTNHRDDEYGQDLARFGVEVIQAVKSEMPSNMPLLIRVSAVEYVDGGYGLDHMIEIGRRYKEAGVDMFHVSSGGEGRPGARKPGNYPGYQVPFARAIKEALNVPVIAVGILEDYQLAESVIGNQDADLVAIARGMLRDPYWATHAAKALGVEPNVPKQYERAY